MEDIRAHLCKDKKLKKILHPDALLAPQTDSDVYLTLVRSIVSQQLSVKAAETIFNRFADRFPKRYPSAVKILSMSMDDMRACGLSYQKAGYLQNIAAFSIENDMSYTTLQEMDDAAVIRYLSSIKGVGKWTVEMILIFSLARPNVFPVDDLGIRNAMIAMYDVEEKGRPLADKLHVIASAWQPWRSYAVLALWDWKDKK